MDKIVKYSVIIDDNNYTITIKKKYDSDAWGNYYYKVCLYDDYQLNKYKFLCPPKFKSYYSYNEYKYNLIKLVKVFISDYKEEILENKKEQNAIKELQEWDGDDV